MDPDLLCLPEAESLLMNNLQAGGEFFLEIFCGCAAITLACMMISVPCIRPWDSKFGEQFNVLTCGYVIVQLILAKRVAALQFATPCQSLTWARSPQLRSALYPNGLPGLNPLQQTLVDYGNELVAFTVECCELLHSMGDTSQ